VHGIDAAPAMIELARKRAGSLPDAARARLTFAQHDLENIGLSQVFDATYCWFTSLGYSTNPNDDQRILRALHKALRPGGLLLLETDHLDSVKRHFVAKYGFAMRGGRIEGHRVIEDGCIFHEHQLLTWKGKVS
jgi:SAM-dependent methyltransferase